MQHTPQNHLTQTIAQGVDVSAELLLATGYRPLSRAPSNEEILSRLSETARQIYQTVLPFQDHRQDAGHANTVIHFTLELARLYQLDAAKTEAVAIAAICHDIGWSKMENIDQVFNDLISRQQKAKRDGSDSGLIATLRSEELELRIRHQDEAVKIASVLLENHPARDEICEVIGDHDTRQHPVAPHFKAFLDGDWLWRVTATSVSAGSAGSLAKTDCSSVADFIAHPATTLPFLLPTSQTIARLEAAHAMRVLQEANQWKTLPTNFMREFCNELLALDIFQSASLTPRTTAQTQWLRVVSGELKGGVLAQPPATSPELSEAYRDKLNQLFPLGMPVQFLNAWHQTLANSSMPIDFAGCYSYERHPFSVEGRTFTAVKISGINHEQRRETIAQTTQHVPRHPFDSYGYRFSPDCALEPNIIQALDALNQEPGVQTNALADFGDYIWMLNKFPWFVGDSLVMPKNHDDLSERALFSADQSKKWTKRQPEETRGAIVTPEYLATVIAICDRFDQAAQRNHALDGMSIPLHDHFKLMPAAHPALALLPEFTRRLDLEGDQVAAYRALNTPLDTLCIASLDHGRLAEVTAAILEQLERDDQIFTIVYTRGTIFITPRNASLYGNGNPEGHTGSAVGYHAIEDLTDGSVSMSRFLTYLARQGTFDWQKYVTGTGAEAHESLEHQH